MPEDRSGASAERPFQPEIPRSHFAEGQAPHYDDLRLGRFSEGEEALPDSPDRDHRGRFSQGQENSGDSDPQKHVRRRFSEGLEQIVI